jgi:hypothetical protein
MVEYVISGLSSTGRGAIAKPQMLHPGTTTFESTRAPASGDLKQEYSGHTVCDFAVELIQCWEVK